MLHGTKSVNNGGSNDGPSFYGNAIVASLNHEMDLNTDLQTLRHGFASPSQVLSRLLSSDNSEGYPGNRISLAELTEALKNAVSQASRLNRYRLSQKATISQLHQKLDAAADEYTAAVDAIRHHQKGAEAERQRAAAELTSLRSQLAKANAQLARRRSDRLAVARITETTPTSRTDVVAVGGSSSPVNHVRRFYQQVSGTHPPVRDLSPASSGSESGRREEELLLELDQLRSDLIDQKTASDRQATRLRGQLAEASEDIRSLRLQLARLQQASGGGGGPTSDLASAVEAKATACAGCHRLQRLVDLLQAKSEGGSQSDQVGPSGNNSADQLAELRQQREQWTGRVQQLETELLESRRQAAAAGAGVSADSTCISRSVTNVACQTVVHTEEQKQLGKDPSADWTGEDQAAVSPHTLALMQRRLEKAETEAELAMLQVKKSNCEFLALRERLSHAAVERNYLKDTVENMDEQVSQLESALCQRTQQVSDLQTALNEAHRDLDLVVSATRTPGGGAGKPVSQMGGTSGVSLPASASAAVAGSGHVTGVAVAPEYVSLTRDTQSLLPLWREENLPRSLWKTKSVQYSHHFSMSSSVRALTALHQYVLQKTGALRYILVRLRRSLSSVLPTRADLSAQARKLHKVCSSSIRQRCPTVVTIGQPGPRFLIGLLVFIFVLNSLVLYAWLV